MPAPPTDQRYRPIGFELSGGGGGPAAYNFWIRHEDFNRTEPSRLTVTQTLGGAWADLFGRGIQVISLSGHTGWRGSFLLDGAALFYSLRDIIVMQYHDRRSAAINAGQDPDSEIELLYIDSLDDIVVQVVPRNFVLRRSRSRPLLYQYQMQLVVLAEGSGNSVVDGIADAIADPLGFVAAATGLSNALSVLQAVITGGPEAVVGGLAAMASIVPGVGDFLSTTVATIGAVTSSIAAVGGAVAGAVSAVVSIPAAIDAGLMATAQGITAGGANAFGAIAAIATAPAAILSGIVSPIAGAAAAQVANAMGSAQLALNAIVPAIGVPNFSILAGASGGSDMLGGGPPSVFTVGGLNPFEAIQPVVAAAANITAGASAAISSLSADVQAVASSGTAAINTAINAVAGGITLPGAPPGVPPP